MARPLNELLSVALEDLAREFARTAIDHPRVLSLEIHANLLRHLVDDGAELRDIPMLARISKRAVRSNIAVAERSGWIVLGGETGKRARLTAAGRGACEACEQCLDRADAAWRKRFGDEVAVRLRSSLEALVSQFDLELPHHPTGYGPADASVTGGVSGRWGRRHALRVKGLPGLVFDPVVEHQAAGAWEKESGGRLYVRDSGQDWHPVPRGESDTVSELPQFALLSQAVMAFAIDYEGCGGLSLARSGNLLRNIGDEGVVIALRPSRARGSSPLLPANGGLAALERHAYAEVVADPRDKHKGRFSLTEKGKRVRDAYDDIVVSIEQRWKRRDGAGVVRELRGALSSIQKSIAS